MERVWGALGEPPMRYRDAVAWSRLERDLGARLPAEYKEIVDGYAPVETNGHLRLMHPAARRWNLADTIRSTSEAWFQVECTVLPRNGMWDVAKMSVDVMNEAFGPAGRFRPAKAESWREIEEWAGLELPRECKEFVDGYGDAVVFRHLFIAHPEGVDPLLKVMQEERQTFLADVEGVFDQAPGESSGLGRFLPWAYHDFNGDICLLVPPSAHEPEWTVAVSFRQCPEVQIFPGGIVDFLRALSRREFPRGWPQVGFGWRSVEGSPLG